MKQLRIVTLSLLLISLTSCNSFRFTEHRIFDETNCTWTKGSEDDQPIPCSDPILFDDYVLVPREDLLDLYENYNCRLKENKE
jgi:hypothetical protein